MFIGKGRIKKRLRELINSLQILNDPHLMELANLNRLKKIYLVFGLDVLMRQIVWYMQLMIVTLLLYRAATIISYIQQLIGIGSYSSSPLPQHRTYGSVYGA